MSYFKDIPSLWNTSWIRLPFLFASPFVLAHIGGWKPFYVKQSDHFMPFDVHFSQDIISLYVYEANIGISRNSYYFNDSIISILILAVSFISFLIIVFYPLFNVYEIRIERVKNENNSNIVEDTSHYKYLYSGIKNIFSGQMRTPSNRSEINYSFLDNNNTSRNKYREFVAMISGDEHAAERLISLEALKYPGKTRHEIIDIAIAKLLRDRH